MLAIALGCAAGALVARMHSRAIARAAVGPGQPAITPADSPKVDGGPSGAQGFGFEVGSYEQADAEPAVAKPRGYGIEQADRLIADPPDRYDEEYLLALVPMTSRDEKSLAIAHDALGPYSSHVNQGNPAISRHRVSHQACLDGLANITLQTEEQRAICGHPYEVPVHTGDPSRATACIDVFEYPNRPCVLPFVYSYEIIAERLCALDGKRLCTEQEWNTACEADPAGGAPSTYAYGNTIDLSICNTGKPYHEPGMPLCDPDEPSTLWTTCGTNTEPSGSFPRCRSRLGVFDMHGNVAEAMTRKDKNDGVVYSQLKGSAFFYDGAMYPDHCRYDPRWHVEVAADSWHSNYHLGFRCCRDIAGKSSEGDAGR